MKIKFKLSTDYDRKKLGCKYLLKEVNPLYDIFFKGDIIETLDSPFKRHLIGETYITTRFHGSIQRYDDEVNQKEHNDPELSIYDHHTKEPINNRVVLQNRSVINWVKFILVLITKKYADSVDR